jgi:hypothetical protein
VSSIVKPVKMSKWPNVKTPIVVWSEKVRKLLQGLRHYVP